VLARESKWRNHVLQKSTSKIHFCDWFCDCLTRQANQSQICEKSSHK